MHMSIQPLYPNASESRSLKNTYLSLNLHQQASANDVLIYANYIASLDGRIALRHGETGDFCVPQSIANKRDWRLYQELAAQSGIMLTSARYFRQLEKGCAQDLLPVGQEKAYQDLAVWREMQGLKAQPDIMIVSASLDIPLSALQSLEGRKIYIITVKSADEHRKQALQDMGAQVLVTVGDRVDGMAIKTHLVAQGYRSAYMIAGPAVHQTLLAAGVLNRLFLTTHLSLLAQNDFHTILQGDMQPVALSLRSLYLDNIGGQMFGQYDITEKV